MHLPTIAIHLHLLPLNSAVLSFCQYEDVDEEVDVE
jgi:hypothetical protein